jgi:hypothetical protein
MENNKSSSSGIGIGVILFLIFLVLKLCGVIDWSWWWVTIPLWGVFAFICAVCGIALIGSLVVILIASLFRKKRK